MGFTFLVGFRPKEQELAPATARRYSTVRIAAPSGGLSRGALYWGVGGVTKHRLEALGHDGLTFSRWLAYTAALSVLFGALIGILLAD